MKIETVEDVRQYIETYYDWVDEEGVYIYENPDYAKAFRGITTDGRALYEYGAMVESLMEEDNIEAIDAMEFIDYNTLGAYINDRQPIVFYGFL